MISEQNFNKYIEQAIGVWPAQAAGQARSVSLTLVPINGSRNTSARCRSVGCIMRSRGRKRMGKGRLSPVTIRIPFSVPITATFGRIQFADTSVLPIFLMKTPVPTGAPRGAAAAAETRAGATGAPRSAGRRAATAFLFGVRYQNHTASFETASFSRPQPYHIQQEI